ncbi:winged helix-turn-helix domain-containing protein [Candidatus Eisenbacteria bacterium]|uniref:Winged helix-turn-helix domain-containing protein n=1 Tax=Eiseniibacteriota bacterium TaxID=2212470 RepID=A0ABV6YJT1_UNCEI
MEPPHGRRGDAGYPRLDSRRARAPYRLGEWLIEPRLNRITGPSGAQQLEPKLTDLLLVLASQPGEVFTREELLDLVWPDVVVGEEVLTRGISELRRLLGDDSRTPRYIETIRKGGYRIICDVRATEQAATTPTVGDGVSTQANRASGLARISRRVVLIAGVIVIVLAAVGLERILSGDRESTLEEGELFRPRPLTTYPGNEVTPVLSPDGRLVAFSWDGPQGENYDLYVLQIGASSPLRLTDHPAVDIHPVWSHDGSMIAYIHDEGPGVEIRILPALGGASRRLVYVPLEMGGGFTWSPDGATIVYAARPRADRSTQLYLHNLETEEVRTLTPEAPLGRDDVEPEFSPDGESIAFLRRYTSGFEDLCVVPASGGEAKRVRAGLLYVVGLDWARSGDELLCSALHEGSFSLWRINLADGRISWSSVVGDWIYSPSIARHADRLVYHQYRHERNIWRVALGDPQAFEPEPVIAATQWDSEPSLSPDGRQIAFTSTRSGMLEVWVCRSDGSRPHQLTAFDGCLVARPRWSPDGKHIAFNANPEGISELYIIEADGGRPRKLIHESANVFVSEWSLGGRRLYFSAERDGRWEIWRLNPSEPAGAAAVQVTSGGGIRGYECEDGYFYYAKPDQAGLWRLPLSEIGIGGGNESREAQGGGDDPPWLAEVPELGSWNSWAVCADHIILITADEDGSLLVRLDIDSGERVALARVPGIVSSAIALDRDCTMCLYTRIERAVGDLMLVEGFR